VPLSYQAGSWNKPRRVVAKVEWHPGELYPRVGFIVTNLARPVERLVAFYNHRGTEEFVDLGDGKSGVAAEIVVPPAISRMDEAGIVTAHFLRRSTDRTLEEVADLVQKGGILFLDDYGPAYPEVVKALRRTSMRPKILPNSPEIRGMSG
jgi:hypothetical protein